VPAANFQTQFRDGVENGFDSLEGRPLRHAGVEPKTNTIRAMRKRPFRVGDRFVAYWALRSKSTTLLGEGVVVEVKDFELRLGSDGEHRIKFGVSRPALGW